MENIVENIIGKEISTPIEELKNIIQKENIDHTMTFRLNNEKDGKGEEIEGNAFWVKFKHEGKIAEGKLFSPKENKQDNLIIFNPGMPGGSVTWMEKKFIAPLLDNGYTIVVLRHLGTKTEGEESQNYIHSSERSEKDSKIIGDKAYNIEEMSHEVEVVANSIGKQFNDISIIGHSSGVLNSVYSAKDIKPDIQSKVNRLIALSGFIDNESFTDDFKNISGGLEKYYEYCSKHLNIGSSKENVQVTKEMITNIYDREDKALPENTMIIQVNSPDDEIFTLEGAQKFQKLLNRGLNITDKTQSEQDYHDLKNLQPDTLLRLLKMHYPRRKHNTNVIN